ncbi:MAG TPA: hypothetical protein VLE99_05415 [Candidatus Saccharimonadales bacterium]|nr:hypothetical protein [Candidatus Saccharimonadales bacterium]
MAAEQHPGYDSVNNQPDRLSRGARAGAFFDRVCRRLGHVLSGRVFVATILATELAPAAAVGLDALTGKPLPLEAASNAALLVLAGTAVTAVIGVTIHEAYSGPEQPAREPRLDAEGNINVNLFHTQFSAPPQLS